MADLAWLPISELAPLIRKRAVTALELTRATLDRIERFGGPLGAFVAVLAEQALASAAEADHALDRGAYLGPLHGMTVAVKDNIDVAGVPSTACCPALDPVNAPADAAVVTSLRRGGAVMIGKTRMWELAMRIEATPPAVVVRNPWNPDFSPMGSTSGGAAALAAGLCHLAIGTDTGGSLRGPAGACGVVGLKPTHGVWSLDGVIPVSKTLDHGGPLTRTAVDAAIVMGLQGTPASLRNLRIGVITLADVEGEISAAFRHVVQTFVDAGATAVPFSFPGFEAAAAAQTIINERESALAHRHLLDERRDRLGQSAHERLKRGLEIPDEAYASALRERDRFRHDYAHAFAAFDVLITPTSPRSPPLVCEAYGQSEGLPANVFRWPFNLLGAPAISVPCGLTSAGLPLGLQIAGLPQEDQKVVSVAIAWEELSGWGARHPSGF